MDSNKNPVMAQIYFQRNVFRFCWFFYEFIVLWGFELWKKRIQNSKFGIQIFFSFLRNDIRTIMKDSSSSSKIIVPSALYPSVLSPCVRLYSLGLWKRSAFAKRREISWQTRVMVNDTPNEHSLTTMPR